MTHGLLTRPMSSPVAPAWSGAVWVGELDAAEVAYTPLDRFRLVDHEGYATARFLLRRRHTVLGFVEAPVVGGTVDVAVLREGLRALPRVEDVADVAALPDYTEPVALLAQTTLSHRDWGGVADAVKALRNRARSPR